MHSTKVNGSYTTTETVYATTGTVYYYVTNAGEPNMSVVSWTGYNNAPKSLSFDGKSDKVYAVYTESKSSSNANTYYNAEVIVIEANSANRAVYFAYGANAKTDSNKASAITIGYSSDDTAYVADLSVNKSAALTTGYLPWFYQIDGKGVVTLISKDYNDYGIYASTVVNGNDNWGRNYTFLADKTSYLTSDVTVYKVNYNANGNAASQYTVSETTVAIDDQVIYFMDGNSVAYVLDVTQSYSKDFATSNGYILDSLYTAIGSQKTATGVEFYGVTAEKKNGVDFYAEVEYAAAVAANKTNGIEVTKGTVVIGDKTTATTPDKTTDKTYTGTILGTDGVYYTFKLVQKKGNDDATAKSTKSGVVVKDNGDGTGSIVIAGDAAATVNVGDLMNAVAATDPNASLTWEFTSATGEKLTGSTVNKGADTDAYKPITATVESEDGKKQIVYTLVDEAVTYNVTVGKFYDVDANGNATEHTGNDWSITIDESTISSDDANISLTVKVTSVTAHGSTKVRTFTAKIRDTSVSDWTNLTTVAYLRTDSESLSANDVKNLTASSTAGNPLKDITIDVYLDGTQS
jgi:hypothetical protein